MKAIFDFIYNFIVLILIIEILSGIIIDTFAELRQEEEEKKKDMENYCFICGLNRRDMDRQGGRKQDYNFHISKKHNKWNYLYYMAYILDKPETELSGIESYVYECREEGHIHWFPLSDEWDEE